MTQHFSHNFAAANGSLDVFNDIFQFDQLFCINPSPIACINSNPLLAHYHLCYVDVYCVILF